MARFSKQINRSYKDDWNATVRANRNPEQDESSENSSVYDDDNQDSHHSQTSGNKNRGIEANHESTHYEHSSNRETRVSVNEESNKSDSQPTRKRGNHLLETFRSVSRKRLKDSCPEVPTTVKVPNIPVIQKKYDVVVGSRYIEGVSVVNWPLSRIFLSYFANLYVRIITGMPIKDATSGFF